VHALHALMLKCRTDSSRIYTYGQLAESQIVTGKPSATVIAMETLQVTPPRVGEFREPTQQEAEAVMKEWREAWRVFVVWLFMTAVFTMFYVIYLEGLYLALAVGVVFTVITSAMYFSPWFKTSDRLFVLMAFMVGTFMTDFICAFFSIVFGYETSLSPERECPQVQRADSVRVWSIDLCPWNFDLVLLPQIQWSRICGD